jgi:hypothetical protein
VRRRCSRAARKAAAIVAPLDRVDDRQMEVEGLARITCRRVRLLDRSVRAVRGGSEREVEFETNLEQPPLVWRRIAPLDRRARLFEHVTQPCDIRLRRALRCQFGEPELERHAGLVDLRCTCRRGEDQA